VHIAARTEVDFSRQVRQSCTCSQVTRDVDGSIDGALCVDSIKVDSYVVVFTTQHNTTHNRLNESSGIKGVSKHSGLYANYVEIQLPTCHSNCPYGQASR